MMRTVSFMTQSYYIAEMAETALNRGAQILPKGEARSPLTMRPRDLTYFCKKEQIS